MLRDNSCVCRSVYYCAIKLGRFDAPSRHFQLVKKHTHTRKTKKKKKKEEELMTHPPIYSAAPTNYHTATLTGYSVCYLNTIIIC